MKLIDKDSVVTEIEKLKGKVYDNSSYSNGWQHSLRMLEIFINSIEAEEVDLDKELDFVKDAYYYFTSDERSSMKKVARHFFELGLKAKG